MGVLRPNKPKLGLWQPYAAEIHQGATQYSHAVLRRLGAIHRALDLVTRGFFGLFARGFPGFFGACRRTCTNCPNRGGTAAALTIGPAATSLFRRESTCRFSPSSARAPSSRRTTVDLEVAGLRTRHPT